MLAPGGRVVVSTGERGSVHKLVILDKDASGGLQRPLAMPKMWSNTRLSPKAEILTKSRVGAATVLPRAQESSEIGCGTFAGGGGRVQPDVRPPGLSWLELPNRCPGAAAISPQPAAQPAAQHGNGGLGRLVDRH